MLSQRPSCVRSLNDYGRPVVVVVVVVIIVVEDVWLISLLSVLLKGQCIDFVTIDLFGILFDLYAYCTVHTLASGQKYF